MPGNIFVSPHYQFHKIYNGKQATKKWMNEWMICINWFFFAWWCKCWILFFHFHVQYLPMDLWWWQRKKTRFIIVEFEEKSECENRFFCLRKLFFHSLFLSAWLIRWSLTKKKIAIFKILKNKNHVCACVCFFYSCMLQLFLISILNTIYMWKILWIYTNGKNELI